MDKMQLIEHLMENAQSYRWDNIPFEKWYNCSVGNIRNRYSNISKEYLRQCYELLPDYNHISKGMPCTTYYWSDRRGGTITEVYRRKNGNIYKIGVTHNKYTIKDHYDGYGECSEELATWQSHPEYFTLRRGGGWYGEGLPKKNNIVLAIGYRSTYIDPHF